MPSGSQTASDEVFIRDVHDADALVVDGGDPPYTAWLKRATPQNIVIGAAAGSLPPVIGWIAAAEQVGFYQVMTANARDRLNDLCERLVDRGERPTVGAAP